MCKILKSFVLLLAIITITSADNIATYEDLTTTAQVISGNYEMKGIYVDFNKVVTLAHGIEENSLISVDSMPAKVIKIDRVKDLVILETEHTSEKKAILSDSKSDMDVKGNYKEGDSGTPLTKTRGGKIYGLLIGKNNKTGEYVYVPSWRILEFLE